MNRFFIWSLLLFSLTVLPYVGTVRYGLVNCDDYHYFAPGYVPTSSGLNGESVRYSFRSWQNAIWMPLTYLAYGADYAIGGQDRAAQVAHAGNVVWHGLNAVLLFWLLEVLVSRLGMTARWPCVLAAILWAWHPLRCESVAWIASKKDVMSAFWLLTAILLWARWRSLGGAWRYAVSLIALLAGAMCKPSVMVFIGIAGLLDWLVFAQWRKDAVPRLVREYAAPAIVCLVIACEAAIVQRVGGGTVAFVGVPLWWRLLNASCSVGVYAINTVFPVSLAPQCMMQWPGWPRMLLPGLVLCAVLVLACRRLFERKSAMLAGLLWFLGCLAPFLGISGFGYHAFADRFTYIPAMGLSFMAAIVLSRPWVRARLVRTGAGIVAAGLAILTLRQCGFWQDDKRLWERTLAVDGQDNYIGNLNLASWHWEFDHDVDACATHYSRAWKHDPAAVGHHAFYYVAALLECGRREEARKIARELQGVIDETARAGGDVQPALWTRELAYALLFATASSGLETAERSLNELLALDPGVKEDSDRLFIRGIIADMRGDELAAGNFYRLCRGAVSTKTYMRYRFLTDEWISRRPMKRES